MRDHIMQSFFLLYSIKTCLTLFFNTLMDTQGCQFFLDEKINIGSVFMSMQCSYNSKTNARARARVSVCVEAGGVVDETEARASLSGSFYLHAYISATFKYCGLLLHIDYNPG